MTPTDAHAFKVNDAVIDFRAPDPVPFGYLTLHEVFETFYCSLYGKTSAAAMQDVQARDENVFFSQLSRCGRNILDAQLL